MHLTGKKAFEDYNEFCAEDWTAGEIEQEDNRQARKKYCRVSESPVHIFAAVGMPLYSLN